MRDLAISRAIADTVDSCATLPILEIGPGTGVLTQFLKLKDRPFKMVEIDHESVVYLHSRFPELRESIIEADFLTLHLESLFEGQPFVLTGNYPYNISSQIFFKMLDNINLIPCCTGMVQREVACRITASPGSKVFGILSVFIQLWYNTEYLFTVNENVFDPPPKVKSAVIRMTRNSRVSLECNSTLFRQVVKGVFGQRRKMLRNSIRSFLAKEIPLPDCKWLDKRPEQLSVDNFIELTLQIQKVKNITK